MGNSRRQQEVNEYWAVGARSDWVMKDVCLELSNNPAEMALVGEILGSSGINIEGLSFTTHDKQSVVHCVVEDAVTARRVLENAGIKIRDVSEVFVLNKDEKKSLVSLVASGIYAGRLQIMELESNSGIRPKIIGLFLELMISKRSVICWCRKLE